MLFPLESMSMSRPDQKKKPWGSAHHDVDGEEKEEDEKEIGLMTGKRKEGGQRRKIPLSLSCSEKERAPTVFYALLRKKGGGKRKREKNKTRREISCEARKKRKKKSTPLFLLSPKASLFLQDRAKKKKGTERLRTIAENPKETRSIRQEKRKTHV